MPKKKSKLFWSEKDSCHELFSYRGKYKLLFRETFELLGDPQELLGSSCLFLNNDVLVTGPTSQRWPKPTHNLITAIVQAI